MLSYCGGDIDLAQLAAKRPAHGRRVAVRAVGCSKSRHRDGENSAAVKTQQVKGSGTRQQRQRGIQTTGNANHRATRMRVRQALGKTMRLDGKNRLATLRAATGVRRHKRMRVDESIVKRDLAYIKVKRGNCIARSIRLDRECRHAATLCRQKTKVDHGGSTRSGMSLPCTDKLDIVEGICLAQHAAVLGNQAVTAIDYILCRFAPAGTGVSVGAHKASAGGSNQVATIVRLAHQLIRSREVADKRGTCTNGIGARRIGDPKVLADLCGNDKARHGIALKKLLGAKRNLIAASKTDHAHRSRAAAEAAAFVELTVHGDIPLGHKAQKLAMAQHRGTVVELRRHAHGHAHKHEGIDACRLLG